jgi:hypothetical protein
MTEIKTINLVEKMQQAFKDLCEENPPRAFLAITVGEDMMVNFASYGVETGGTIDLLEHMLEYIKSKESEDEYGRDESTKFH